MYVYKSLTQININESTFCLCRIERETAEYPVKIYWSNVVVAPVDGDIGELKWPPLTYEEQQGEDKCM